MGAAELKSIARQVWCAVLDLLFPRRCASCGEQILVADGSHVCSRCLDKIPFTDPEQTCMRCGLPIGPFALDHEGRFCEGCRNLPLVGFRRTVAVGSYEGALRRTICRFKYSRRSHLADVLGRMLADRAVDEYGDTPPDICMAVPLHPSRRRERTFDQAQLLAGFVAREFECPLVTEVLLRNRSTPTLTHQTRAQRAETIAGVFDVSSRKQP